MGADICVYVECKRSNENRWRLDPRHMIHKRKTKKIRNRVDCISFSRDYTLFEKLAGVRGEMKNAIVPPRGLPLDISDEIKAQDYREAQMHTWLTLEEIRSVTQYFEPEYLSESEKPFDFTNFFSKKKYYQGMGTFKCMGIKYISCLLQYLVTLQLYGPIDAWQDEHQHLLAHLGEINILPSVLLPIIAGYLGFPGTWQTRVIIWFKY